MMIFCDKRFKIWIWFKLITVVIWYDFNGVEAVLNLHLTGRKMCGVVISEYEWFECHGVVWGLIEKNNENQLTFLLPRRIY